MVVDACTRVLVATQQAGGATCLFPVVASLKNRQQVEVCVFADQPALAQFAEQSIDCEHLQAASDDDVRDAAAKFHPQVIITGLVGPIHSGLDYRFMRIAKQCGLPRLAVLDAWMNLPTRFADPDSQDPLAYVPEQLAVMDERTAADLVSIGVPSENILISGHPYLQYLASRQSDAAPRNTLAVPTNKRAVLFLAEPVHTMNQGGQSNCGYDECDAFSIVVDAIGPDDALLVKEHPRRPSRIQDRFDTHSFTPCMDQHSFLDLILSADVIVGMSSTLLVYATLLGKHVITIQPNLVRAHDRNILTRRGILKNTTTVDEFREALQEDATPDQEQLRHVRRTFGWDQRPADRVADVACELARIRV